MAKRDTGLKSTLTLGPKVPVKNTPVDIEKTEAATKRIHASPAKKEGKWFRLSTDLPENEFIQFKTKLLTQGKSRQGMEVVRELIKAYISE